MIDLLLFSLCVSLATTAIHVSVMWDGMILNFLQAPDNTPSWLKKPVYECLICMSSYWTVFFWCAYVKPVTFELLFAVLITGGINTLIRCLMNATTDF